MSPAQKESHTSIAELIGSIGLFVGTALLCQVANKYQWHNRAFRDDDDANANEDEETMLIREWYRDRRLKGRRSYENLQAALKPEDHPKHPDAGSKGGIVYASPQTMPRPSVAMSTANSTGMFDSLGNPSNVKVDYHPNAEYDFHPKNRNWRHFEHFNDEDLAEAKRLASLEQTQIQTNVDSNSLSSDGSSEEAFVWTDHLHKRNSRDEDEPPMRVSAQSKSTMTRMKQAPNLAARPNSKAVNDNNRQQPPYHHDSAIHVPVSIDELKEASMPTPKPSPANFRRSASLRMVGNKEEHEGVMRSKLASIPRPPRRRSVSTPNLEGLSTKGLLDKIRRIGSETSTGTSETMPSVNDQVRAKYNARIMPEKVVLVRHGQSMGNIDEALYSTVPDNAMPLTDLGWRQARAAGEILKQNAIASNESVHFIVSPYVRTVETFHGLVSAWCDPKEFSHIQDRDKRVKAWYGKLTEMGLTWNEDPRIREQDFGNYQVPELIKKAKRERHRFGIFYYRFQNGESASDVFDRVSTFLDSLWRNFDSNRARNYVLVTHGISIRVFLARYFRYTIDQFNMLANPQNCEMVILGHNGKGQLELDGRCQLDMVTDEETKEKKIDGHTFHRRLRILPQAAVRKMKIRISPDD